MKMKIALVMATLSVLVFPFGLSKLWLQHTPAKVEKPGGYIPDSATAVKIAEAIWVPIYGKDEIESEKPFHARLIKDSVWLVEGSLPEGYSGGTAIITLRKSDCKVLEVIHEK